MAKDLVHFGTFCPVRPSQSIWSILVHLVHFGLIWSISDHSVHFSPFWSNLVLFSPFGPPLFIRSNSIHFGPFWSNSVDFGPHWSILVIFSLLWSISLCFDPFGPFRHIYLRIWKDWFGFKVPITKSKLFKRYMIESNIIIFNSLI